MHIKYAYKIWPIECAITNDLEGHLSYFLSKK